MSFNSRILRNGLIRGRRFLSMSNQVKITTYNVLSSHLGAPDWFKACNPEDLYAPLRLERLKKILGEETQKNSIICLQEVSMTWAGDLYTFFSDKDYNFILTLYGNKFNNYMGVGIAYPRSTYSLVSTNVQRIADTLTLKYQKKEMFSAQNMTSASPTNENPKVQANSNNSSTNSTADVVKVSEAQETMQNLKPPLDPWYESSSKFNQLVAVTLKHKTQNSRAFTVGTYHMPCVFQIPALMLIHSCLSTQYLQSIAKGNPYIFCGDFNFTPRSSMYKLITNGTIDEKDPDYPPFIEGFTSSWLKVDSMVSAYKQKLGVEPDYTNHAKVKDDPVFIDTLDYIFLSNNNAWEVNDVKKLPKLLDGALLGPLPINTEPSDHLLLSAQLTLNKL